VKNTESCSATTLRRRRSSPPHALTPANGAQIHRKYRAARALQHAGTSSARCVGAQRPLIIPHRLAYAVSHYPRAASLLREGRLLRAEHGIVLVVPDLLLGVGVAPPDGEEEAAGGGLDAGLDAELLRIPGAGRLVRKVEWRGGEGEKIPRVERVFRGGKLPAPCPRTRPRSERRISKAVVPGGRTWCRVAEPRS
jgi:hypothetical protein